VRRAWGEGNSAQRQENDEGQDAARQTQLLSSASRAPSDASYKTIFMSDVELCTIRRERTRCIWRKTREIWKMAPEETALSIACGFRIVNDSMEEPHPETRRFGFFPFLNIEVRVRRNSGGSAIQGSLCTSLLHGLQSSSKNRGRPPSRTPSLIEDGNRMEQMPCAGG